MKTVIGMKKTLAFYIGNPIGQRTNWVIHKYCATNKELNNTKVRPGVG